MELIALLGAAHLELQGAERRLALARRSAVCSPIPLDAVFHSYTIAQVVFLTLTRRVRYLATD